MKILVYGPRKAGTTLFQRLLDGGDLFVHPRETKIKFFLDNEANRKYSDLFPLLKHPEMLAFDFKRYEEKVFSMLNQIATLQDFVNLDVEAASLAMGMENNSQNWAVKEVGGKPDTIVSSFLSNFPDAKVLIITRNYKFVARAILTDRRRRNIKLSLKDIHRQIVTSYRVVDSIKRLPNDPRVFVVNYEYLVQSPQDTMQLVSKFLGIQYNDIMSYPTLNGRGYIVDTSSKHTNKVFKVTKSYMDGLDLNEKFVMMFSLIYIAIKRFFISRT